MLGSGEGSDEGRVGWNALILLISEAVVAGIVGLAVVTVVDTVESAGGNEETASFGGWWSVSPGVTGDIKASSGAAVVEGTATRESNGTFCEGAGIETGGARRRLGK